MVIRSCRHAPLIRFLFCLHARIHSWFYLASRVCVGMRQDESSASFHKTTPIYYMIGLDRKVQCPFIDNRFCYANSSSYMTGIVYLWGRFNLLFKFLTQLLSAVFTSRHPHHLRSRLPDEPEELSAGPHAAQGPSAGGHCQGISSHVEPSHGAAQATGAAEAAAEEVDPQGWGPIRHGHVERENQGEREATKSTTRC